MTINIVSAQNKKLKNWERVTHKTKQSICNQLLSGKSIQDICASTNNINAYTLHELRLNDAAFSTMFVAARQIYADFIFDSIHDKAKALKILAEETHKKTGKNISYSVLRATQILIDTEKWMISKLSPSVYGDTKENGGTSQTVNIHIDAIDAEL